MCYRKLRECVFHDDDNDDISLDFTHHLFVLRPTFSFYFKIFEKYNHICFHNIFGYKKFSSTKCSLAVFRPGISYSHVVNM